jgi:3',5'-cyclic AMP phosphodiesterase CpdA
MTSPTKRVAAVGAVLSILLLGVFIFFQWTASRPAREKPSSVAGTAVPAILGTPLARIAAAGDTGTGGETEKATAERIRLESAERPYDALLLLGDLVYENGDAALVDSRVRQPFQSLIDQGAQLVPVLGNHDYESAEQQKILTALGRTASWYVQDVGPVRIIVLDSNRVEDRGQLRWLREVLSKPDPPGQWTIVAMHHPAYSSGAHGSNPAVRKAWGPLFAEYGVPLVLSGHDHDYERSTPQDGVTYVVSGAGAKLRPVGNDDFTAVSAATRHYLDLLVYEDRIVVTAIDQAGSVVDRFEVGH